ncbi:MAG TPA: haloacid dehalogenase-like hydrolase [Terriglobales bacterium]|nr:haloacid dehalogenase-like hydrolase [Terriglobales bacterium]
MSTEAIQNAPAAFPAGTNLTPEQFLQSALSLRPRIAVFDCDGTLWSGDAGRDFFFWEIEQGLIPDEVLRWVKPRYADYKAGKVDEATMCGEMVTIHAGLSESDLESAAERFFEENVEPNIFPIMRELTRRLAESGCELWAVSSTNEWVVRAGTRRFGIPDNHVIAACVHIENSCATDRLLRVPTDEAKATAIREVIAREVDAVFGNSMHDAAMLSIAANAFAINPNPDLGQLARERGWSIYFPEPAQR